MICMSKQPAKIVERFNVPFGTSITILFLPIDPVIRGYPQLLLRLVPVQKRVR